MQETINRIRQPLLGVLFLQSLFFRFSSIDSTCWMLLGLGLLLLEGYSLTKREQIMICFPAFISVLELFHFGVEPVYDFGRMTLTAALFSVGTNFRIKDWICVGMVPAIMSFFIEAPKTSLSLYQYHWIGVYAHKNHLANMFFTVLILLNHFAKNNIEKALYWIILCPCILFTQCYAAILCMTIFFFCELWRTFPKYRKLYILSLLGFTVSLCIIGLKYNKLGAGSTLDCRVDHWIAILRNFNEVSLFDWFIGGGSKYWDSNGFITWKIGGYAHNIWFEVLSNYGIISLFFIGYLVYSCSKRGLFGFDFALYVFLFGIGASYWIWGDLPGYAITSLAFSRCIHKDNVL